MRHLNRPDDDSQNLLFDADIGAWWHTQLSPQAFRRLEAGMEGLIRRSLLRLLPAGQMARHFHPTVGRPTKELYAVCGLLLLAEFRDLTIDQAADAWSFDASVQFALNLPRDRQYLCARTVDSYRQLLREDEAAQDIFEKVTAALVEELGLEIGRQRLDSTHVLSNMATFGRLKLLAVTVKRFLTQLRRHHPGEHAALPEELRARYDAAESRLFGFGSKNPVPRDEALQSVGEDIVVLLERFAEAPDIASRTSYKALDRVFKEHCEVQAGGRLKLRDKALDKNGQSARTLQNPSDEEAGYSGHKGAGYQVQIAQTFGQSEGDPGLIVACVPQSAAESDSGAVADIIAQQERMGTLPKEQLADTAYGSDANVTLCKEKGIELIAPVPGRAPVRAPAPAPAPSETSSHREEKSTQAVIVGGSDDTVSDVMDSQPINRIEQRRAAQQTLEWKERYAPRSGIEGVHEALDRTTGVKRLRVRGKKAVHMAIHLKVTGWNIAIAARLLVQRRRKARRSDRTNADTPTQAPASVPKATLFARRRLHRHRRPPTPAPSPSLNSTLFPPKSPRIGLRRFLRLHLTKLPDGRAACLPSRCRRRPRATAWRCRRPAGL